MGKKSNIVIGSDETTAQNAQGLVVIVDVFRAFTTAAVAFANGAERIIMVGDLDSALSLREQGIADYCMGERHGDRPDGFDFGNSPAEIQDQVFDGKTLVQTTSNGTRGIVAANQAKAIYTGSLINADATVHAINQSEQVEVALVAMGSGIERTEEDELCALYLRSRLTGLNPDKKALKQLLRTMSQRVDGNSMSTDDFECCLRVGELPFAIRVQQESGMLVARRETSSEKTA